MKTVLTHLSALEYWRSPQSDAGPARLACRVRSLPRSAPCSAAIGALPPDVRAQLSLPVHVLSLDGRRKSTRSLIVHQAAALPAGSLRSLSQPDGEDTLLVTSPELTFVHLASLLSYPRTVHLGYELCGTYAPDASRPFGVRERPPLTTPAKLAAYLDEIGSVRGVRQARSALAHVLCRSASPPESTLAMLLTLPCARGGSGMIRPRMNEPVSLGKRGSWTTDRSGFRCDLLWPGPRCCRGIRQHPLPYRGGSHRPRRRTAQRARVPGAHGCDRNMAAGGERARVQPLRTHPRRPFGNADPALPRLPEAPTGSPARAAKPSLTLPPSPLGLPKDVPGADTSRSFGFTACIVRDGAWRSNNSLGKKTMRTRQKTEVIRRFGLAFEPKQTR